MKNKKVIAIVLFILLIGIGTWYSSEKIIMILSPKMAAMDAMGKAMNASFQFYGKIIDQHGNAVPDVKIKYDIGGFGSFGQPRVWWGYTDADSNGEFQLSGNGDNTAILSMEKKGYEFAQLRSYDTYPHRVGAKRQYLGTPEKPVVIHAWKKIEAEGLVYKEIFIGFSPDGKTYAIDLIQPKKTEGGNSGDIKVTFNRPLDVNRGNRFNWSVSIEAISGGLIETTDVFMNQAPESGYQSVWKLKMKKDSPDYQAEVKRKFYLKSRNGGVYGRLELEFTPLYNNQSVIDAKWWLNPNGSRNLQYDPAKRIYPK